MSDAEAIVRWLIILTIVSYAFAPFTWWLADGLGQAASGLVRALGIFILAALLWWPAAVLGIPYSAVMLVLFIAAAGAAGWVLWLRAGRRVDWRPVAAFESQWLLLFSGYVFFRAYQPNIANTEKPMEIALLSSVSRSASVPAPDPWFAGESINYYYFGYQTIASLVKLSGVPTSIAFNLALATLFASAGTAAAAVGYRIAKSAGATRVGTIMCSGCATFFILLAGNLAAAWRLIQSPGDTFAAGWWYDGVGWQASRVIVDHGVHGSPHQRNTINEFPAFSFVLGDLHPHVITYPLLLGIIGLVVGVMASPATLTLPRTAVIGALVGLLYVSNSWDAPLGFLLLAIAVITILGWRGRAAWIALGVAAVTAVATTLPFLFHFTPPVGLAEADIPEVTRAIPLLGRLASSLGFVTWRPSSVGELIVVHGPWLAGFALFLAIALDREHHLLLALRKVVVPLVLAVGIAGTIAIVWSPASLLIGVPLALGLFVAVQSNSQVVRIVSWLFTAGFLLVLIPEYVYIQDAFGDRMNTVFKLFFQAWALLALATASTLALGLAANRTRLTTLTVATFTVLFVLVAPYTPLSARDWTDDFSTRYGLDGAAYIARSNPGDAAAIDWLHRNATDSDIIVEGPGCSYQSAAGVPMNRMSAFTGVPTLVGWEGHQRQWRRGEEDLIDVRVRQRQDVANRWLDGAPGQGGEIISPTFIVLGFQERYGSETCDPLPARDADESQRKLESQGWRVVFEAGETRILARQ